MDLENDAVRRRAFAMLLLANLYWGLSFPVIKALSLIQIQADPAVPETLLPLYALAPRFLVAAILLFAWRPGILAKITAAEWGQGLALGSLAGTGMLLQTEGLRFTHASTSAFLTQFYAVLIPLWWAVVRRRLPAWPVWVAVALVLVGGGILSRFDLRQFSLGRGETVTLVASLFFMVQILLIERPRYRANDPMRVTFAMFVVMGVLGGVAAGFAAGDVAHLLKPWQSGPWVLLTLALAVFCSLGAFTLMNAWQPKISSTEAGLIYCVEPLFGALFALWLPSLLAAWTGIDYRNETLEWTLVVGGGLITAANILLQFAPAPSAKRVENG